MTAVRTTHLEESTMPLPSFTEFESASLAQGFDEVLERVWAPGQVVATHAHPFAVQALVVAGEFWLGCGGQTRHLRAGERFALDPGVPHDERYGPEGATFWAARRHPSAAAVEAQRSAGRDTRHEALR